MASEEITANYVQYKFKRIICIQNLNRVRMMLKLNLAKGPAFVLCLLKIINLIKEIFILDIEQGMEVRIPSELNMNKFP